MRMTTFWSPLFRETRRRVAYHPARSFAKRSEADGNLARGPKLSWISCRRAGTSSREPAHADAKGLIRRSICRWRKEVSCIA